MVEISLVKPCLIDESTSFQVMAWCGQETSHNLGQCWQALRLGATMVWNCPIITKMPFEIIDNRTLKRKCHFAEIFITGCTRNPHHRHTTYGNVLSNLFCEKSVSILSCTNKSQEIYLSRTVPIMIHLQFKDLGISRYFILVLFGWFYQAKS